MKRINFINSINPKSFFDFVGYEDIRNKEFLDHNSTDYHIIEFYAIILITGGSGKHSIDSVDYDCTKGSLLTIRKGQIHKFHSDSKLKGSLLLFTRDFLSAYLEEMESHRSILLFNELLSSPKFDLQSHDYKDIRGNIDRISSEYFTIDDNYSPQIIRSELHILISKLFRMKNQKERIQVNKKYLKEFLMLQELVEQQTFETIKVKDYAQQMGKSAKTLNTITQSIVHKSAKEFIDDICTTRIKRLLLNTDLPIKEIAYMAGFDETSNFYKYFKRQTNTTPEQYRNRH